ncbi:MAG: NAD(P)H-hydrate epimerase [Nitrososphaerales archaeon]|jgi:NAD(P)H-hydrate epimerase
MKSRGGLSYVSAEEMARIDSLAIEDYHVDVLSLMENAGVASAIVARLMLGGSVRGKPVACLVGKGNNGGDGLVAARHLRNWGAEVTVFLSGRAEELRDITASQLRAVGRSVQVEEGAGDFAGFELLVDAMLGYNSKGNPREPISSMIRRANESRRRTLAIDIPSGLDPTTGEPYEPCLVAEATITLALPKTGFLNQLSKRFVGDLFVADISIPEEVYKRMSVKAPDFGAEQIVRVVQLTERMRKAPVRTKPARHP